MASADHPSSVGPGSLGELGEFGLIQRFRQMFPQGERVFVGPGDDAAVLRAPRGHVVISTDLSVENRHFRRDWSSPRDIGRKAAAQNLADIAAMGGVATGMTVGLVLPDEVPVDWVLGVASGIAEEAGQVGASVIGGDVSAGSEVTIAITVFGECANAPVLRSGAVPGQTVALAGRQGWSAAGLAVLARGFRSPRAVVEAHQRPVPPYPAGPAAAAAGATAMIDVSDGLLADVGHLASASGVSFDLWSTAFLIDDPLHAVGAALGVEPLDFVLGGGEDHSLVATFPADVVLPAGFRPIGRVGEASDQPVVTVDGAEYGGPTGHRHFG